MSVGEEIDFSFIIPTYNRAEFLKETIASFFFSTTCQIELIVVDDGGTDNSEEVVRSFNDARIRYFKIRNSERGAARNYGLRHASGKYINYFDSDDVFLPCLDGLNTFLKQRNFPDVVFGIIEGGSKRSTDRLPYSSFHKNLLHNNFLACGSVFLSKHVASKFPFHEDRRLSSAEDWELWLRVAASHEFCFFSEPVFRQRMHDERSIVSIRPERIEERDNYFATLIRTNQAISNYYSKGEINLFVADRYTFIALAWCATDKKKAWHYLTQALRSSASVISRRRFWAVLKKIVFR